VAAVSVVIGLVIVELPFKVSTIPVLSWTGMMNPCAILLERDVSVAKYNSSGGRSLKEAVAVFSPAA
jgi:hypothetical protein